jgi:anti-sigma factor RsiW
VHPEIDQLLIYVDGEMGRAQRRGLERHLEQCPECRDEVRRLRMAALAERGAEAPPRAGLLERIRQWEAQRRQVDPRGTVVTARVATEIAPFLGEQTSVRIVQAACQQGRTLLSTGQL